MRREYQTYLTGLSDIDHLLDDVVGVLVLHHDVQRRGGRVAVDGADLGGRVNIGKMVGGILTSSISTAFSILVAFWTHFSTTLLANLCWDRWSTLPRTQFTGGEGDGGYNTQLT